jgi:dTDP-4-dehydrorhamnose reductase
MHLLVTGASGLLGLNLSLLAIREGNKVTGLVHSHGLSGVPFQQLQVDLLQEQEALFAIQTAKPDAIIHCAAQANLNLAERDPQLTHRLNAEVPGFLAAFAKQSQLPFIHISTDAVFDGERGGYVEDDPLRPSSVYAKTKLAGEQAVLENNPDAIITRVVFYGWSLSGKRSLGEFFFNNLKENHPINGFTDTFFSPLYVEDLSKVLLAMLTAGLKGIYHVVSPQSVSKYEFGVRIAERFGLDPGLISPIQSREINRGASRSLNLSLKPDKIQKALGITLPSIDAGLEQFYRRWQQDYPQKLQSYAS